MFYSRSTLLTQLQYDGFSAEEATYGADNCGADWNMQATVAATHLVASGITDKDGLVAQLQALGFTADEAVYGAAAGGL